MFTKKGLRKMSKWFRHKNKLQEEEFEWEDFDTEESFEEYAEDNFTGEEYIDEETVEATYEGEEYEAEEYEAADGDMAASDEEPVSYWYEPGFEAEEYEGEAYPESMEEYEGEAYPESMEEYEGEVYFEGTESYEEGTGSEEGYYEEEVYYEEEAYYEGEDDVIVPWSAKSDESVLSRMWRGLVHLNVMDKVVAVAGVLVLVLAIATGAVFLGTQGEQKQVASAQTVGNFLNGVTVIGEQGLTAVADAQLAKIQAANAIEDNNNDNDKDYNEGDYTREVEVALNMTSIEKDLKVKFVNNKTNKLIANVPFSITVKTPNGTTEVWEDDDMDGIIYKSSITPGEYSVSLNALEGEKYAGYTMNSSSKKVTVKKEIAYEKVDVSDEIKGEDEINVSEEDGKGDGKEIESTLKDTVGWVESTQTVIDAIYTAVEKTKVPDPLATAKAGTFYRAAEVSGGDVSSGNSATTAVERVTLSAETLNMTVNSSSTLTAAILPANATDKTLKWESSDSTVVKIEGSSETVTLVAQKVGTATIKVTAGGKTAACTVTVTQADNRELTVPSRLEGVVGVPISFTVTVTGTEITGEDIYVRTGHDGDKDVTNDIITIKSKTVTKGENSRTWTVEVNVLKAGTETIYVTLDNGTEKQIPVTIADTRTMTLDKTVLSLMEKGKEEILTLTVDGNIDEKDIVVSHDGTAVTVTQVKRVSYSESTNKTTFTLTVTPAAAGSATIKITCKGAKDVTCTVKVEAKTTKLVDANKEQLYVLVSGNTYREATYEDYYNKDITTLYLKTGGVIKYTGWQTIDGKVYYFDASGKKVTGEQVIQGAKYTFDSDGALMAGSGTFGIDVSKYNGTIDWNAVKNSGVNYVIIRCGYRGYGTGVLVEDPKFAENIKGANAAGIKVGVYFFTQAINRSEAVEEASMVLQLIKNYKISYPVFLDVEYSGAAGNTGRADNLDKSTRTEVIKAFCETIQNSGYTAGVYANKSWLTDKIDASQLTRYKIWLAQYAAAPTYTGRYDMWQYSSKGKVTGISGDVDLNISYLGY